MADATHLVSTDSWADDPLTWFVVRAGRRAACPLRARDAEPPVRGRGQRRCIGILGGSSGLTSDSFSRSDSAAKDVRDNAILSAAMRSGAVASRRGCFVKLVRAQVGADRRGSGFAGIGGSGGRMLTSYPVAIARLCW